MGPGPYRRASCAMLPLPGRGREGGGRPGRKSPGCNFRGWTAQTLGVTSGSLPLHRLEELFVCLRVLQLVENELGGWHVFHGGEQLAQDPHALQLFLGGEQFLATSTGAAHVDGG